MKPFLKIVVFITVLFSLTFSFNNAYAQISSYKIETAPKAERIFLPYDSLQNITRDNIASLVGQQVQILPRLRTSDLETGPTMYTGKPNIEFGSNEKVIEPDTRFTIYNSRFGAFDNQVFEIVGVDSISRKSFMYSTTQFYLLVKNDKYSNPCYLEVGLTNDELQNGVVSKRNPFWVNQNQIIIVGYFEKLRSSKIGRKFVNSKELNPVWSNSPTFFRLSDGKEMEQIPVNTVWEIKDITFIDTDTYKGLSCILTSDSYDFEVFSHGLCDSFISYDNFLAQQQAKIEREKALIRKYGRTNGNLIIEGKVKLGFTKKMCEEAWGAPKDINKTTGSWGVHEQWVYGMGCYLYFENGKLTAIDN